MIEVNERFTSHRVIGAGTFSTIYETKQSKTLKTLDLDLLDDKQLALQLKEVWLSKLLDYRHVLQFEEVGTADRTLCISMAQVSYGSCLDAMKSTSFSENTISVILEATLSALQYLHSHQIIHRAIQASNLLMGKVVLLKGLKYSAHLNNKSRCHALPPRLEERLPWAAPELIGQDTRGYTHKADIYSFGITILELLAGYAPFQGFPNTKIYLMKLSSQNMLPFSQGSGPSHISKRLARVIDKCVQYEAANRSNIGALLKSSFFVKMRSKCVEVDWGKFKANCNNHAEAGADRPVVSENTTCKWIF